MKKIILYALLLAISAAVLSCGKKDSDHPTSGTDKIVNQWTLVKS